MPVEPTRSASWERNFRTVEFFMRQAVSRGLSFNEFYRAAREAGLSYRRANMLEDWRAVKDIYKYEYHLQRLDENARLPDYAAAPGAPGQRAKYLVGVEYDYIDAVTGETRTGVRVIASEELMQKRIYLDTARHTFAPGRMYEDPTAHNFRVRWILKRRDLFE